MNDCSAEIGKVGVDLRAHKTHKTRNVIQYRAYKRFKSRTSSITKKIRIAVSSFAYSAQNQIYNSLKVDCYPQTTRCAQNHRHYDRYSMVILWLGMTYFSTHIRPLQGSPSKRTISCVYLGEMCCSEPSRHRIINAMYAFNIWSVNIIHRQRRCSGNRSSKWRRCLPARLANGHQILRHSQHAWICQRELKEGLHAYIVGLDNRIIGFGMFPHCTVFAHVLCVCICLLNSVVLYGFVCEVGRVTHSPFLQGPWAATSPVFAWLVHNKRTIRRVSTCAKIYVWSLRVALCGFFRIKGVFGGEHASGTCRLRDFVFLLAYTFFCVSCFADCSESNENFKQ